MHSKKNYGGKKFYGIDPLDRRNGHFVDTSIKFKALAGSAERG
jgi:hypothetical protein